MNMTRRDFLGTSATVLASTAIGRPIRSSIGSRMYREGDTPLYDSEVEYLESTGTQYIYIPINVYVSWFEFSLRVRFTRIPTTTYFGTGYTTSLPRQFFYALSSNASNGLYMSFNGTTDIARNVAASKLDWHEAKAYTENGKSLYFIDGMDIAQYNFTPFNIEFFGIFCIANPLGKISGNIGGQQISACALHTNWKPIFDMISVRFTNEKNQSEGAMYDRVSGQLFRNQGTGSFIIGPDV